MHNESQVNHRWDNYKCEPYGEANVIIEDEKIAAVVSPQSDVALSALNGDTEVIDASGMYVIPGN